MQSASLLCPVIVGRDAERAMLGEALDAARSGRGRLVGVAGEAGVGKSRLLQEVAASARARGMTVLTGRALPRRSHPPLRALAEALQPLAGDAALLGDDRVGPFRGALDRLLLCEQTQGPGEDLVLGEAVVRLLTMVGEERGCLLLLEDLHWSEPAILDILGYCADHLTDARVLCLGSVRTGEDSDGEREVRLLAERRAAELVLLPRLDAEDTDRMLRACLDSQELPADLRRFVRDRSEGVPFFVEELLAGLVESDALRRRDDGWEVVSRLVPRVPLTFAEAVHRRVDGLGEEGRAVLEAAALLGRSFDPGLLSAATGVRPEVVAASLSAAIRGQLLSVDGGGLAFRHALSREVVLSSLLPPLRCERAAGVLAALEQAHPELPGEWLVIAADLAEHAGKPARAARLLLDQARQALAGGSVAAAGEQLRRARALADGRRALSLTIDETEAQAAALAGEIDRAEELAARALPALAVEPDGDRRQAKLLAALARAAVAAGNWSTAQMHLGRLGALLDERHDDVDLRANALALRAQVAIAVGDEDQAAACARAAVTLADAGAAPAAACESHEVLGRLVRPRDVEAARRHFAESLRIARAQDLTLWRARALHELGTIDLYTTQDEGNLLAAREAAVSAGAVTTLALVELHLGAMAGARWQPRRGLEPARRCVELSRRLGLGTLGMGLLHLAGLHAQLGDEAATHRLAAEALAAAPGDVDVEAGVPGRALLTAALRRGAFVEARRHLDAALAVLRDAPERAFPFRGVWALLHETVGGDGPTVRAEARAHADSGIPFNAAVLDLADAVAAGRAGSSEEAARRTREVLDEWRRHSAMDVWAAILLRLVGEAAITDGWGTPHAWLAEAAATFDAAGYAELASSCRAVLRCAGAPVPRRGRGEAEVPPALRGLGVTSREMDVLGLLSGRLTNREIAERLHLSTRTVDRHVANLLAKTALRDRRALAGLAGGGSHHPDHRDPPGRRT